MSKKNQDTKQNQDKQFGTLSTVPDGFTMCLGPNGEACVVLQYLILAPDHAFVLYRKKVDLEVLKGKPEVRRGAVSTVLFAAHRHCRACHSVPCLGTRIYLLFPWLIFSMTDKSSQKQPLFHAWREVDVSPGSGEENFQWLDWVDLICF